MWAPRSTKGAAGSLGPATGSRGSCPRVDRVPQKTAQLLVLLAAGVLSCWTLAAKAEGAAIDTGGAHSCAIEADLSIECWGGNFYGQTDHPSGAFTSLSSANVYSCALRAQDGGIECWGSQGIPDHPVPPPGSFIALSAQQQNLCGIRTDATIACSANYSSQSPPPSGSFSSLSLGAAHACAIRTDDATLTCWSLVEGGDNHYGRLDAPSGTFVSVSAGGEFACAIRTDATLACWGLNDLGQATPPPGTFASVSAGDNFACAIKTIDASVICWGSNEYGQLDALPDSFNSISARSQNGGHVCGIRPDGRVQCWGHNNWGQAPLNPLTDPVIRLEPPSPPALTDTDPDSPANDNNPVLNGVALAGTTVRLYDSPDCSGSPIATLPAVDLGTGISASVPDDSTTAFRATATNSAGQVSPCSWPLAYTEDSTPPETTINSGPAAGSTTNDNTPTFGCESSEPAGASFECRALGLTDWEPCTSPFTSPAVVPDGSYTGEVRAIDAAGNVDPDPATRTVTIDTVAPDPPNLAATSPASPSADASPELLGSAEAGSQVRIYTTSGCSGAALATGTAAELAAPGITVAATANATTTFYATATDVAGNPSSCSAGIVYTQQTVPANVEVVATTLVVTAPAGATDNISVSRPTVGIVQVRDRPASWPGESYSGARLLPGAGCSQAITTSNRPDPYAVNCGAGNIATIEVFSGDRRDLVGSATSCCGPHPTDSSVALPALLDGGAGPDTLTGDPARQTLVGGAGVDNLYGHGGNDLLQARDGTSDNTIGCGTGTADVAEVDPLPLDRPNRVRGCETTLRL